MVNVILLEEDILWIFRNIILKNAARYLTEENWFSFRSLKL